MKRILLGTAMLVLSVTVVACGQSDNNGTANQDNANDEIVNNGAQNNTDGQNGAVGQNEEKNTADNNTADNTTSDDRVQKMESLEYIDFELDVKYTDDQDYEADLELENNRVDAKLEDDLNGIEIEGDAAFDELYPLVEQLTIDQNTSKEDVITQVLDVFDLPTDYEEFELEIKFKDGTKKEYDDR